MKRVGPVLALLALPLALAFPGAAWGEIFKYKKADGTVVYTDSLAELPRERREHYNQKIAERELARRELEAAIGKEELARREAEAKRAEAERQAQDEKLRAERLAAFDAQIAAYKKRDQARQEQKKTWQQRLRTATTKLGQLLQEFRQKQERWSELATRASFTLLPGQNEERARLEKELASLEAQIDALIVEIDETIPEEARKAGIPPGWLRE
jgi:chromosome segregation ATPase